MPFFSFVFLVTFIFTYMYQIGKYKAGLITGVQPFSQLYLYQVNFILNFTGIVGLLLIFGTHSIHILKIILCCREMTRRKRKLPTSAKADDPIIRKSGRVSKLPLKLQETPSRMEASHSDPEEQDQQSDDIRAAVQQLSAQLQSANQKIEDLQNQLGTKETADEQLQQANKRIEDLQSQLSSSQSADLVNHQLKRKDQPFQDVLQLEKDVQSTPKSQNSPYKKDESQEIIANALQQLINPRQDENKEGEQVMSSYLVLGSLVDKKIKMKIWMGEYIDLSQLKGKEDHSLSVSIQNDGTPSIALKPNKSAPPANIFQWLELFSTYASIYLERFPSEAPAMLTYINRILDLSRKYPGLLWRIYDEKFRQARIFGGFQWHEMRWELIMESTFPIGKSSRPQPFRDNNRRFQVDAKQTNSTDESNYRSPQGYCFTYDKTGKCQNYKQPCKFIHACSICRKRGHYRLTCYQNKQTNGKSQEPQPGSSMQQSTIQSSK